MAWQFLSADQSSRLTGSQRGATPCCRWLSGLIIGRLRALSPAAAVSTYSDKLHKCRTIIHCQRASRGDAVRLDSMGDCIRPRCKKVWSSSACLQVSGNQVRQVLFTWKHKSCINKTYNNNTNCCCVPVCNKTLKHFYPCGNVSVSDVTAKCVPLLRFHADIFTL